MELEITQETVGQSVYCAQSFRNELRGNGLEICRVPRLGSGETKRAVGMDLPAALPVFGPNKEK